MEEAAWICRLFFFQMAGFDSKPLVADRRSARFLDKSGIPDLKIFDVDFVVAENGGLKRVQPVTIS